MFIKKIISLLAALTIFANMSVITVFAKLSEEEGKYFTMIDISERFNAKSFLSPSEAGTIQEPVRPDYFISTAVSAENSFALNRDNMLAHLESGMIEFNGVTYLMHIPKDSDDSYSYQDGGALILDTAYYDEIRILAATTDLYNVECGKIYYAINYTDGTKSGTATIKPKKHDSSDTVGMVASCGIVNATKKGISQTGGNIYEYIIKNPNPYKKAFKLSLAKGGKDNSGTRIFAVTGVETSNAMFSEKISEILSTMPNIERVEVNDYLTLNKAKEYVDYLQKRDETYESDSVTKYKEYLNKIDELASKEVILYVDNDGSDTNIGSIETPLKSLEGAKNAIRLLKTRYPDAAYKVFFREGEYYFSKKVSFDNSDSGTAANPVIYEAYEGEIVEFVGSKTLNASEFSDISDESITELLKDDVKGYVKELDLKKFGIEEIPSFSANTWNEANREYTGIYLNGKEQPIAQFPNGNGEYAVWDYVINPGGTGANTSDGATIAVTNEEVRRWGLADDFWIGGYFATDYRYQRVNGKSVDTQSKTITFKTGTDSSVSNTESKRWKAFNLIEELDNPGEWYIDRDNLMLYYYPPCDVSNDKLEISVFSDYFAEFIGCENLVIRNIRFLNTQSGALNIGTNSKNITVEACLFKNIAKIAIRTYGSVRGSFETAVNHLDAASKVRIHDCNFYNIGSSAIYMIGGGNRETLTSGENEIYNNHIEKIAQNTKSRSAIQLDGGVGTEIKNNVIHNTPFHAITIAGNDHSIQYNEIENACNEVTDAGTIYSGRSYIRRGCEISYNFIHDYRVHGNNIPLEQTSAIYLDDMMSGVGVHHNIIVNGQTGIHVSGGQDNDIENNILINLDRVFYTGNPGDDPNKLGTLPNDVETVTKYPIWCEKYPDLLETKKSYGPPHRNVFRYNLSDRNISIIQRMIDLGTVSDNYVTEEDIFTNPKALDYRIKSNSEIIKRLPYIINDSDFDIESVGIQVTENRTDVYSAISDNVGFAKYYPGNNAKNINPYDVLLSWEETELADSYKLKIATDINMENVVYEDKVYTNFCRVKNLDANCEKFYWQVYAISNLRQINSCFEASDGVYCFETVGSNWIYESDAKASQVIDLSEYFNHKAFLAEGETDSENESDVSAINKTRLKEEIKKMRNSLNVDGVVYSVSEDMSVIPGLENDLEIPVDAEICDEITFLANAFNDVCEYSVRVYYEDSTYTDAVFNIGAQNKISNFDGVILNPDFKLGTVDSLNGKATMSGGYIYSFKISTESDKKVNKIVFSKSSEIQIFAITAVLPEVVMNEELQYNIMLNSNKNSMKAFYGIYDGNGKLLSVKSENFVFNTYANEKLIKLNVLIPDETVANVSLYFWDGVEGMKPYSYKITKEVKG